jgi:hypothetical protein
MDRLLPWRAVVWAKAAEDDGIAAAARIRPQSHVFANANQLASAQAPIAPSANDFPLMKFSRPFGLFVYGLGHSVNFCLSCHQPNPRLSLRAVAEPRWAIRGSKKIKNPAIPHPFMHSNKSDELLIKKLKKSIDMLSPFLVKKAFASELEKNKRAVSPENLQRKI